MGKLAEAKTQHQYIIDHFPESKYALEGQRKLIEYAIKAKDEATVQAGIKELKSRFSRQEVQPLEFCRVANIYDQAGNYSKASELYTYIRDNIPESIYAAASQR